MKRKVADHQERGFVLVVVLGAVLTLSALLFAFNRTARTGLDAAYHFYKAEQARNHARAGLNIAVAVIGDVNDSTTELQFSTLLGGRNSFHLDHGTCSVTATDTSGLLNINALKDQSGRLDRRRIDQLLRLIDLLNHQRTTGRRIGYGVVPAIIDWTDADAEVTHLPFIKHESMGAEDDYYRTCSPPYACRNKPMDTIDDLLWVKGMTPQAMTRLRALLTTFGEPKININAAPKLIIECLSEEMDAALAQMVVNRRDMTPFDSVAELKDVPGMTDNIYQAIKDTVTVGSERRHYRVTAQGHSENHSCTIEAVLRRNTRAGNVDILLYREL